MKLTLNSAAVASDLGVVTVRVKKKTYILHNKLLTEHSGYFRRTFDWKDGTLTLNGIDEEVFDVFIDWIYEKKLPSCIVKDGEISLRYYAYALAEELSATSFKTALMDCIFDQDSQSIPRGLEVAFLFFCLPEEDPMLQFLVDTFCLNDGVANMSVEDFAKVVALPKEYLFRILRKLHQLSDILEEDRMVRRGDYIMMFCVKAKGISESSIVRALDEAKDPKGMEIEPSANKKSPNKLGQIRRGIRW